jgi:thiol-disulfide isomerase/thioredoxin
MISSRRLFLAVAAILLGLTASGCSTFHGTTTTDGQNYVNGDGSIRTIAASHRDEPIDLSGPDLDGKQLSLSSMRGKPTVVNVWGSWCASCHAEQPKLSAAARELGDKAHFVGIDSRDNGTAQAKAYTERYGITWPSFFSPSGQAVLAFAGSIGPNAIPSTVILDARGRVAATIIGQVPGTQTLVDMVEDAARG